MTEQELKALLQDMTLEEKIDQMNQVMGGFFTGEITAMGNLWQIKALPKKMFHRQVPYWEPQEQRR